MQKENLLNVENIQKTTIDILKSKAEWNENETKINVKHRQFENVEIFLIQINCVSSTMMLSQNWPKEQISIHKKPVVLVFRADKQLSGRGQKQNSWESPEGNLYLTFLLKLQFSYFPYLPITVISTVFNTIQSFLIRSKCKKILLIKWINDVMLDFEKMAGVLIKNQMVGQSLFTEIGIGINLVKSNFPLGSITQPVTSFQQQTGQIIKISQICDSLVIGIVEIFYKKNLNQVKEQSKKIYEKNLAYLNRDVIIYDFKYQKILATGVFKCINQFGHALIQGYEKPFTQGRMKAHHLAI